jgi:hypothetical protein
MLEIPFGRLHGPSLLRGARRISDVHELSGDKCCLAKMINASMDSYLVVSCSPTTRKWRVFLFDAEKPCCLVFDNFTKYAMPYIKMWRTYASFTMSRGSPFQIKGVYSTVQ